MFDSPKKPVMSWPPLRYMEEKDAFWSNTSFASTSKASKLQALQLFLVKPNCQHLQPAHHTDSVPLLPKASRETPVNPIILTMPNLTNSMVIESLLYYQYQHDQPKPCTIRGKSPPKLPLRSFEPPSTLQFLSVALRVFQVDIRGSAFWGSATIFSKVPITGGYSDFKEPNHRPFAQDILMTLQIAAIFVVPFASENGLNKKKNVSKFDLCLSHSSKSRESFCSHLDTFRRQQRIQKLEEMVGVLVVDPTSIASASPSPRLWVFSPKSL